MTQLLKSTTNVDFYSNDGIHIEDDIKSKGYEKSSSSSGKTKEHGFQPYENNGGTCVAIGGDDYVILAADTRMSQGYSIISRNVTKVNQLTDKCVIGTAGMQSDMCALHKLLKARNVMYKHEHKKKMTTHAISQMLGNILYQRRFFPYYTFNVLAGLDEEGKGAVYNYDAVGSFQRVGYTVSGTGQNLIQPMLDNQINQQHQKIKSDPLTMDETIDLIKDVFSTAGERDIYTGDTVEIFVITKDGVEMQEFALKED
eukprot:TRINITY_DN6775_c0_g1_i1.p1 TRINITY_DN6775_c0_g1~~TRINITY_DN6775_c0_g1_i1.p1  ORF type:complete len:256 (+),score=93.92 TRINITY_DN6775_c0_g1_i1:201-968(+)